MNSRSALMLMTLIPLAAPHRVTAQTGTVAAEITVKLPINLTQLSPAVPKIRVNCSIASQAIPSAENGVVKFQEIPVSGGQVVTTVTFVFSYTALDNPVGKHADIACNVMGYSSAQTTWVYFSPTASDPLFKVSAPMTSVTPFTW